MSYYGGTIELESAEWNDKKAVEYELAQAAWGMRLNVWYDLFQWNKNIVCADKRAAMNKLASMPDWNGVLYHMDVPDTAAIKRLAAAERKAEERYREVCAATDIHNRKSKTITCKACGSRVELARFKGSVCPVCKKAFVPRVRGNVWTAPKRRMRRRSNALRRHAPRTPASTADSRGCSPTSNGTDDGAGKGTRRPSPAFFGTHGTTVKENALGKEIKESEK